MTMSYKRANMPTLSPALPGGARLIEFAKKVFGAEVQACYEVPGGGVAHAELRLGDSLIMTGDPMGDHSLPPGAVSIHVPDVDAAYARALDAGASSKEPPKDQFYGDRNCRVIDPFGTLWSIATHVEDVSDEEIKRRMDAMEK